jgi:hypothetical protein
MRLKDMTEFFEYLKTLTKVINEALTMENLTDLDFIGKYI